ncbi:MAG: 50S ribosomal protein L21/unknown domain fusion protein [Candidatus Accumulibacter appositus]|uniref:Poly(3-hydroxyalkanoate) polymerase subunit PhaE n=1 Tax=Candidatus Accumulibacter appositus TaxID=1454003 RepID=A0A011PQ41_9PROT|nr:helix-hairpin-helix domain-containing protein [Accumulibacter sp.]EXI79132.1 MAG: 50S ribosomal protein L21/unknown domain fusion protein [Candidatus Accumulibacter appositus]HRF05507.1 helix-hairpin-helix domain-containing protein [Accumulibacter sp.]
MFKNYKGIFKDLRNMQDRMWRECSPGFVLPSAMNEWQQQTLENTNKLLEQAVRQSLDLQREWLDQWSERAGDRKLKPKMFAELSGDARNSMHSWLDNQNRLWDQWLRVLRGGGESADVPDLGEWEKAVRASIEQQMALLNDWSEMADFKKLSTGEVTKLSSQIEKSLLKSIKTQQRLWSHWFKLGALGESAAVEQKAVGAESGKEKTSNGASAKQIAAEPVASEDDLQKISGIGPGLEKKLKDAGITTLKDIAELSDEDIARLEDQVIRFSGRIKREQWVDQAKALIS